MHSRIATIFALVVIAGPLFVIAQSPAPPNAGVCQVQTPFGIVDLTQIPSQMLEIKQYYRGSYTAYNWTVSLCNMVSVPPHSGIAPCSEGPGYITEYSGTHCETAWNNVTSPWAWDTNSHTIMAKFVNGKGWPATIHLHCGKNNNLEAKGNVDVSSDLHFTFNLNTNQVCGPACMRKPYFVLQTAEQDWMTPGYVEAPTGNLFNALPGKAFSVSMWVNMSMKQSGSSLYLFSIAPQEFKPWRTTLNNTVAVYWNTQTGRLEIKIMTAKGTSNKEVGGTGVLRLNVGHYRLVTAVIDASNGRIQLYVDTILEFDTVMPELQSEGINTTMTTSIVRFGTEDYYGTGTWLGNIGDIAIFDAAATHADVKYMFAFRLWDDQSCVNMWDEAYPKNAQVFQFLPNNKFSLPNSKMSWRPKTVIGTSGIQTRRILNTTNTMPASRKCGVMQIANATLPSTGTFDVLVEIEFPAISNVNTINPTLEITNEAGGLLFSMQMSSGGGAVSKPNRFFAFFFYTSTSSKIANLKLNASNGFADYCVLRTLVADARPVAIDTGANSMPGVVLSGVDTQVTVLSGIPMFSKVAFVEMQQACYNVPSANRSSLISAGGSALNPNYVMFQQYGLAEGFYRLCVYPTGNNDGQTFKAQSSNSHMAALIVVKKPDVAQPLPQSWITSMLHLGQSYYDVIEHGIFTKDYFASVGGEANLQPASGDILSNPQKQLIWSPISSSDGKWGLMTDPTLNNWVQYFAIAIYSPFDQNIAFSMTHCKEFQFWMDGAKVYHDDYCRNQVSQTRSQKLTSGWHQIVMKLHRNFNESSMTIRTEQAYGLSWNFGIPRGPNGVPQVVNYTEVCHNYDSNTAISCVKDTTVDESECYSLGCCYDSNLPAASRCYAPGQQRPKYRPDGRCGIRFPAAGANVSECNPYSAVGQYCCSSGGWCGNSSAHCSCTTCINYQYETLPKARCSYKTWGKGAKCSGIAEQRLAQDYDNEGCRQQCDFTPGCQAYSRGRSYWSWGPASCTLYFGNCSDLVWDEETGDTYQAFCDDCKFTSRCTNCTCPTKNYDTYVGHVTNEECERLCSYNNGCMGVRMSGKTCYFINERCNVPLSNDTTESTSTYSCKNEMTAVPPKPHFPTYNNYSSDAYSFVGCLFDWEGWILSRPSYGTNIMYNATGMTTETCRAYCDAAGTRYFALYNGSQCTCGVRYDTKDIPVDPAKKCNMPCPGNSSAFCGSNHYSMLYQITNTRGPCDTGYVFWNDWCYKYVGGDGNNWLNWTDANDACLKEGAVLTGVRDESENQFLVSFPFITNQTNTRIIWVGARDMGVGDGFEWTDGLAWNFTDWRKGEPNGGGWTTDVEECLEIFSNYATPYKGSWNDRRCNMPYPYVCKKPTNSSQFIGKPVIEQAFSEGSFACVDTSQEHLNDVLVGWWKLDQQLTLPTPGAVPHVKDFSMKTRDLAYFSDTSVNPSPPIAFMPGIVNNALVFGGKTFLECQSAFELTSGLITVAVWVKPDNSMAAEQMLVTKSYITHEDNSPIKYSWGLTMEYRKFCAYIGGVRACTSPIAKDGYWMHVAMSFTGSAIRVFINGEEKARVMAVNSVIPHSPATMMVGYKMVMGEYEPAIIFKGQMDDLRIYNAAVDPANLKFLSQCTPNGAPSNTLALYVSSTPTVTVTGQALSNDQRVGFVLGGRCDGTPVSGHPRRLIMNEDGSSSASFTVLPTNLPAIGTYAVCGVSDVDPNTFNIDLNFFIAVTEVRALNDTTQLTVNSSWFPLKNVKVSGTNLRNKEVIVLAYHPSCNNIVQIAELSNVNSVGTEAYLTLKKPMELTDTLYVCWASSLTAIVVGGPGQMTSTAAYSTGIRLNIQNPGFNFKRLAVVSGTHSMSRSIFEKGQFWDANDFVIPCGDAAGYGSNYFVTVTMGVYTDYLIPNKNLTVCELLVGLPYYVHSPLYKYSAVSPLDPAFDGTSVPVPPSSSRYLGGSPSYFPQDGREYLSSWGSPYSSEVGGCCSSNPKDTRNEWYQNYTITVASLDPQNVYLSMVIKPTMLFADDAIVVAANVVDVNGDPIKRSFTYSLTLQNPQGSKRTFSFVAQNGTLMATIQQWNDLKKQSLKLTFTVDSTIKVVNGNSQNWTAGIIDPPQPPTMTLKSGDRIRYMLHWGNMSTSIPAHYYSSSSDYFSTYGGEQNMQPTEGQVSRVRGNWFGQMISNTWQRVNSTTGRWTFNDQNKAANYSVQFFSGALFSASEQKILLRTTADDAMTLYLDGKQIINTNLPSFNATSRPFTIGSGWHQIFIKFAQRRGNSELSVQVLGNGLAWRYQLPADVPEGATPILEGDYFDELMHCGATMMDFFTGSFDTDFLTTEQLNAPRIGETVDGKTWTMLTTPNSTWFIPFRFNPNGMLASTVHYLTVAVYAPTAGFVSFELNYSVPLMVLWDGETRFTDQNAQQALNTLTINVAAGWHQLMFKTAAAIGRSRFSVRVLSTKVDLSWAPQIPDVLPRPAQVIKGLLEDMMALRDGGWRSGYAAIPFDPNGKYSNILSTEFNMSSVKTVTAYGNVPVAVGSHIRNWEWIPSRDLNGTWGYRVFGGNYNRYWAFALYATKDMTGLQAHVDHNQGYALWMDGKVVTSQSNYVQGGSDFTFNVKQGWHQMLVKLKAPNGMVTFPMDSTSSFSQAAQICHTNGLQMCQYDALCPMGMPRPGVFPVGNYSQFMPISLGSGSTSQEWVQVGAGGNGTRTCGRLWNPSWSKTNDAIAERRSVACCGAGVMNPTFDIQFFPDTSAGQQLGWAFQKPLPQLQAPVLSVDNPRKTVQLVTMTMAQEIEQTGHIMYTTDGSRPTEYHGRRYYRPFNVSITVTINAVVVLSRIRVSPMATLVVDIPRYLRVSRKVAVANTLTIVGLVGFRTGYAVCFAPSNNGVVVQRIAKSLQFAQSVPVSSTFSGLLTVSSNADVVLPPLDAGNYTAIYFRAPSTANTTVAASVKGLVIDYDYVMVDNVALTPNTTLSSTDVIFTLRGGSIPGDTFQFLDLLVGSDAASKGLCTANDCTSALGNQFFPPIVSMADTSIPGASLLRANLTGFTGTLTCMCYAPSGEIQSDIPLALSLASAIPVSISVNPGVPNTPAPTMPATPAPAAQNPTITAVTPTQFKAGDTLTFTGTFFNTNIRASSVRFTRTVPATNVPMPSCDVTKVTATSLICTVDTVAPATSGFWNPVVYAPDSKNTPGQTANWLTGQEAPDMTAMPAQPKILAASGPCVEESDLCVTGKSMYFTGINFDFLFFDNNKISVYKNGHLSDDIVIRVLGAEQTRLTTQLTVKDTASGKYDIRISVNVNSNAAQTTDSGASIVIGAGKGRGWTGNAAEDNTPGAAPSSGSSLPSAIVAVLAVLATIVAVGAMVACYLRGNYKLVEKQQQPAEMDMIEESWIREQNGEGRASSGIEVSVPMPGDAANHGSINADAAREDPAATEQPAPAPAAEEPPAAEASSSNDAPAPAPPPQQDVGSNM